MLAAAGSLACAAALTAAIAPQSMAATGRAGGAGHSSLVELNVLGQKIDVSVHKEITIGGVVTVRLDEQIKTGDTLTVNAVHVIIGGQLGQLASADVVLSQAVCTGVPGGSTPPSGTTGPPTSSQPGGPTSSSTPASTSSSTAAPASSTPAGAPGDKPGNGGNLAKTGVSAVLPLSIAGLVLLAIGAISVLLVRRRRVRA